IMQHLAGRGLPEVDISELRPMGRGDLRGHRINGIHRGLLPPSLGTLGLGESVRPDVSAVGFSGSLPTLPRGFAGAPSSTAVVVWLGSFGWLMWTRQLASWRCSSLASSLSRI